MVRDVKRERKEEEAMRYLRFMALSSVILGVVMAAIAGCGGGKEQADNQLPTRRAKMREIKLSTDRIMVALKNETIDGVASDAAKIQDALKAVIDLYPPEHEERYTIYNQASQTLALGIASAAKGGNIKEANKKFRAMIPYCGKCHEDCAFMLAPAFPEYEE
jgi:cytochrome c556